VVVNPPFGFEDEMRAALALALPLMRATARFLWLSGGE
jgi:23S rRNA A2030 N6-methylase RlmJ